MRQSINSQLVSFNLRLSFSSLDFTGFLVRTIRGHFCFLLLTNQLGFEDGDSLLD